MRRFVELVLVLILFGGPAVTIAAEKPLADAAEAIALYDRGAYADARVLIERLDAEGRADGALLYRLSFCLLRAGDGDASRAVLERARAALEAELDTAVSVEVPFYLVNTYQNLGRTDELRRVAAAAVARVESGALAAELGVDRFRVAKLYADLGRGNSAADWYSKALQSFAGRETEYDAYVRWARDYLAAQSSPASPAPAPAARPAGRSEAGRLDDEAVGHARAGRYNEAAASWRASGSKRPVDPNRARYCSKLAATAATLDPLPETDPTSGARWDSMDKSALQEVLLRQTALVRGTRRLAIGLATLPSKTEDGKRWDTLDDETWRALLEQIGGGQTAVPSTEGENGRGKPLKRKQRDLVRARLEGELTRARPLFVAAGLWFGIGRHGLRETAFFGGFAPLIFREAEWRLDPG